MAGSGSKPYVGICIHTHTHTHTFSGGSDGEESACNVGDLCLIPGLGRSPGEGNDNPIKYSCLENYTDRGAWQATVHGVTVSDTTEWLTHTSKFYKCNSNPNWMVGDKYNLCIYMYIYNHIYNIQIIIIYRYVN